MCVIILKKNFSYIFRYKVFYIDIFFGGRIRNNIIIDGFYNIYKFMMGFVKEKRR